MLKARRYVVPAGPEWVMEHWRAAGRGELALRHCRACDRLHHYPRGICPWCGSLDLDWQVCDGVGVIESVTVVRQGEAYALAYVRLSEGISMLANLVDCEPEDLAIGVPVRVVFAPADDAPGLAVPCFTPGKGNEQ